MRSDDCTPAEEAGFDTICAAEVNNDVMATAQLMGTATTRITVATWIANIYLRHPYVCAQGAAILQHHRWHFILGLGVSHQPVNQALGIDMPEPQAALRRYVTAVRNWLRGEGPATHIPQRPAAYPVPVYVAALASPAVELGGGLADGIMPFLRSATRVTQSKVWAARGRTKASDLAPLDLTLGLPTFLGNDLEAMRTAARQNLELFTTFPFFQRLFRAMGYTDEAALMGRGVGQDALTDRLLDAVCLLVPHTLPGTARCLPHRWR